MSTLGERLKEARRMMSLTQEEVANALGIKRVTLTNWEIGRANPDSDTIRMLADFYKVSADYLLNLSEHPTPSYSPEEEKARIAEALAKNKKSLDTIGYVRIGNKIKEAREERGLSEAELGKKLDSPEHTIRYYEKGKRKLSLDNIEKIAHALDKPLSFFIPGIETIYPEKAQQPTAKPQPIKSIPLLGHIKAGDPNIAYENELGSVEIPKDLDADFSLEVQGNSLIGAGIYEGDIAICKKAYNKAQHGQLVAALIDNCETTLKFLVQEDGVWKLRAANPKYPDRILNPEIERIQGIVIMIQKKTPSHDGKINNPEKADAQQADWADVAKEAAKYGITPETAKRILRSFGKIKSGLPDDDEED